MGALEIGLAEEELPGLVSAWRASNPHIVRLWWDVDKAAGTAVRERTVSETHGIRFICQSGMLFITLPSGRQLAYVKPRIGTNRFGSDCVTYEGAGRRKSGKVWKATARNSWKTSCRQSAATSSVTPCAGWTGGIPDRHARPRRVCHRSSGGYLHTNRLPAEGRNAAWAKGLLLRADGYDCPFYKKD
jgi:DNA polymerase